MEANLKEEEAMRKRSQNPQGDGRIPGIRTGENRNFRGSGEIFRREPLTADDVTRLLSACRTFQESLVITVLLDTGIRIGEFCSLTRENLDWQGRRLTVVGKGGRRRVVPLTERAMALLEAQLAIQGRIGIPARTAEEIVARVARRAGITKKVSPHVLRHTFAVRALQRGISLPSLQKILGHKHLQTTAIYLNISPEEAIREFREKWA